MQEIGIIPEFHGILNHGNFQPYFAYTQAKHGLCNAHHLSELTYVQDSENEEWAGAMKSFLIKLNDMIFQWRKRKLKLPEDVIENFENEYDAMLTNGFVHHL